MSKGHDATDLLCYRWADTRRQLLGLTNPRLAKDYLGALRSTLGNVKEYHDGAGARTAACQQFPEVYEGDTLAVNLAVKQMPAQLRPFMDLHYTLGRGATNRADLLGISRSLYWKQVKACKLFVEGYLAARADRAA
jgi:hypothetical protein